MAVFIREPMRSQTQRTVTPRLHGVPSQTNARLNTVENPILNRECWDRRQRSKPNSRGSWLQSERSADYIDPIPSVERWGHVRNTFKKVNER
jgi:hypothetical protein